MNGENAITNVEQFPSKPSLRHQSRDVILVMYDTAEPPTQITVTSENERLDDINLPLQSDRMRKGSLFHAMYARRAIRELENQELVLNEDQNRGSLRADKPKQP